MIWDAPEARRRKRETARYDWRLVFAWWPVELEGDRMVWLQRYYRRWVDFRHHPGGSYQRVLPGECGTPRLPYMDRPNNDQPICRMPVCPFPPSSPPPPKPK